MDFCPLSNKPCPHAKHFHITDIVNKEVKQLHLCNLCAGSYLDGKQNNVQKNSYVDEILSLIKFLIQKKEQPMKCPNCGLSPQDAMKVGRLGCAVCYDYYKNSIESIVKRCQEGSTHHVGRTPKSFDKEQYRAKMESNLDIKDQIKRLESKMKKAIKVENYEIAGVLKDKIQELKTKIQEP